MESARKHQRTSPSLDDIDDIDDTDQLSASGVALDDSGRLRVIESSDILPANIKQTDQLLAWLDSQVGSQFTGWETKTSLDSVLEHRNYRQDPVTETPCLTIKRLRPADEPKSQQQLVTCQEDLDKEIKARKQDILALDQQAKDVEQDARHFGGDLATAQKLVELWALIANHTKHIKHLETNGRQTREMEYQEDVIQLKWVRRSQKVFVQRRVMPATISKHRWEGHLLIWSGRGLENRRPSYISTAPFDINKPTGWKEFVHRPVSEQKFTNDGAAIASYVDSATQQLNFLSLGGVGTQKFGNAFVRIPWCANGVMGKPINDYPLPQAVEYATAVVHQNVLYVGGGNIDGDWSAKFFCLPLNQLKPGAQVYWTPLDDVPFRGYTKFALVGDFIWCTPLEKKISDSMAIHRFSLVDKRWSVFDFMEYLGLVTDCIAGTAKELFLLTRPQDSNHQVWRLRIDGMRLSCLATLNSTCKQGALLLVDHEHVAIMGGFRPARDGEPRDETGDFLLFRMVVINLKKFTKVLHQLPEPMYRVNAIVL